MNDQNLNVMMKLSVTSTLKEKKNNCTCALASGINKSREDDNFGIKWINLADSEWNSEQYERQKATTVRNLTCKSINECLLLNASRCAKNTKFKQGQYYPIVQGCMNVYRGRSDYRRLLILLYIGYSSVIVNVQTEGKPPDHLTNLEQVIMKIQGKLLTCNIDKSCFGQP